MCPSPPTPDSNAICAADSIFAADDIWYLGWTGFSPLAARGEPRVSDGCKWMMEQRFHGKKWETAQTQRFDDEYGETVAAGIFDYGIDSLLQ